MDLDPLDLDPMDLDPLDLDPLDLGSLLRSRSGALVRLYSRLLLCETILMTPL